MTKWRIQVTFSMDVSGPDELDLATFHFEENHCVGNLVDQLERERDAVPGECTLCGHAEVKLLGPSEDFCSLTGETPVEVP